MKLLFCTLIATSTLTSGLAAQSQGQPMGRMMQRDDARFQEVAPRVGAPLPDVVGFDENRQPLNLKDLKGSYAVIVSGCLT